MKPGIIFVDDEVKILQGMRRMMYTLRDQWEMYFAESGEKALEIMQTQAIDIIISDMRMPGINGLQLLQKTQELHPSIMRIVLSGQAGSEDIIKSVMPIHQYLTKPCEFEVIKNTITRILALKTILSNNELLEYITKRKNLPSLPDLYKKLMDKINEPDSTVKEIGEIVEKDIGMSAKILQLVNSSFFGFTKNITSPTQAAIYLGMDTLKSLVLGVGIFSEYENKKLDLTLIHKLWKHSVDTAEIAKKIAIELKKDKQFIDFAYTAGLLHDIGILILLEDYHEQYAEVFKNADFSYKDLLAKENAIVSATHNKIGAYLLGLWGFSEQLVNAVYYHHEPAECKAEDTGILDCLYLANYLSFDKKSELDMEYIKKKNLEYLLEINFAE